MRKTMMLCVLFFATGCHNVLILSGGAIHQIMVPPTPEMQCVVTALQLFTPIQQHRAIKQCAEEEEKRNGKAASEETDRSKDGEKSKASAKDAQH